jgi:hypothetical protein
VALRYSQGEDSYGRDDLGYMTRVNAMFTTGIPLLIAIATPMMLLVEHFSLADEFTVFCRKSGYQCGGLALAWILSIAVQFLIERLWLHPRVKIIQEKFWRLGRPKSVVNAFTAMTVGLIFFIPLSFVSVSPSLAIFLWVLACAIVSIAFKVLAKAGLP